ncbi:hypothetical protein TNCV_2120831 [Trichonephila clavipes]|nr:hypothetical protein TNCV_2120831 [Trichonephila clavipes]
MVFSSVLFRSALSLLYSQNGTLISGVFNLGNNQKSQGARSGEKGVQRTVVVPCLAKELWINWVECAGALS